MSANNGNAPLPIATQPRRGYEATWEFGADAVRPMPNFGSRPSSAPCSDPDRWSRIRDVLVAGLIVLVLIGAAGLYVSGAFAHKSANPSHAETNDPFAVVGSGGSK
jgi:hypothetical protein